MATLTDDPALVAGALFSLVGGAYVDRLDRRRLVVGVDPARGAAIGGLAVVVAGGAPPVPLAYAAFFLLGTGETVADNASAALPPSVVSAGQLARANARLGAVFTLGNQLAAKPLGAWLFAAAAALPFGFDAATFVVAAALVAALPRRPATGSPAPPRGALRAEVVEGVRWLIGHRALRLLALCLCLMNVTFCAAFAVFVLYAGTGWAWARSATASPWPPAPSAGCSARRWSAVSGRGSAPRRCAPAWWSRRRPTWCSR
jgi:hypothetical protein